MCTVLQVGMGGDGARKQMRSAPRHVEDKDLLVLLWDSHVGQMICTSFKTDLKEEDKITIEGGNLDLQGI